jgi:hypothetical protein
VLSTFGECYDYYIDITESDERKASPNIVHLALYNDKYDKSPSVREYFIIEEHINKTDEAGMRAFNSYWADCKLYNFDGFLIFLNNENGESKQVIVPKNIPITKTADPNINGVTMFRIKSLKELERLKREEQKAREQKEREKEYERTHAKYAVGYGYSPMFNSGSLTVENVMFECGLSTSEFKNFKIDKTSVVGTETGTGTTTLTNALPIDAILFSINGIFDSSYDSLFVLCGAGFISGYAETTYEEKITYAYPVRTEIEEKTEKRSFSGLLFFQVGFGYTFNKNFPLRIVVCWNNVEQFKLMGQYIF